MPTYQTLMPDNAAELWYQAGVPLFGAAIEAGAANREYRESVETMQGDIISAINPVNQYDTSAAYINKLAAESKYIFEKESYQAQATYRNAINGAQGYYEEQIENARKSGDDWMDEFARGLQDEGDKWRKNISEGLGEYAGDTTNKLAITAFGTVMWLGVFYLGYRALSKKGVI